MFSPTPIEFYSKISQNIGINLDVKRDDYFPLGGGGNKARKISYIFQKAINEGCNAVVTAGASNSNHARVVAIQAARMGWKAIIIVHDLEDYNKNNLLLMKLAGAELIFVDLKMVSSTMDKAMLKLDKEGFKPYYIWGGGHCVEGSLAYVDGFNEILNQSDKTYDFIIHASGTGTTQAGLHFAAFMSKSNTQIIGISIAREKERGISVIKECLSDLNMHFRTKRNTFKDINFYDEFTCGGYGKISKELIDKIREIASMEGLILDPTYTGKAFLGLTELVKNGIIPKQSNVLFLHTGGNQNLFEFKNNLLS